MSNSNSDIGPMSAAQEPVMRGVERTRYDLSHWSMKVGSIGGLQTLSCIPVVAGDSLEVDASVVFRLSPLRRNMYLDCVVDMFAFFVPHRHIYGSNWVDFIKQGYDEAITLGTDTIGVGAELQATGLAVGSGMAAPRWLTRGYIQIWNRYFRDPSDTAGVLAENYFTTLGAGNAVLDYGVQCAHLKRIWNCAINSTLATTDYRLPLTAGEVDLYTLAALQGRLKTESAREWFATRYQDILKHSWDSQVNIDADQRPELVMRTRQWLSGYDVDGTDDATLGTYSGKGQSLCQLKFPRKFFPEHGALWLMALLRFPPIHDDETHYLVLKPEPTYSQIAGDPDVIRRTGPVALDANEIFAAVGSVPLGTIPYGQWLREHPSSSHHKYTTSLGHPFLDWTPSSRSRTIYIQHDDYDSMFNSLMLKHWNSQGFISVVADRFVPPAQSSIFAATE